MAKSYDFGGWATKNDLRCMDGLIIRHGAFSNCNGKRVPLMYNHVHDKIGSVIGHADLSEHPEGIWADCSLNNTQSGKDAKEIIKHGDVVSLSIWANEVQRVGSDVIHGNIREVSLVPAGANPGAFIESVVAHGVSMEEYDDEGIVYTGEPLTYADDFMHAAPAKKEEEDKKPDPVDKDDVDEEDEEEDDVADDKKENSGSGKTVGEVFDTLTDEQKLAVAAVIEQAIKDNGGKAGPDDEDEEEKEVKHNAFDNENENYTEVLSHSDMKKIFADAKRLGSLRESVNQNIEDGVLMHSIDTEGMIGPSPTTAGQTYGFRDPDMLFPDYRALNNQPEWISRNMDWVNKVLSGVHRSPFSRIKSMFADITEDEARALGYIKGHLKKEEVFTLLKRTTDPQTIYKKQKLDRDDIVDITDFDIVAWIRAEMRIMLNEEIARAILIGDGRNPSSDDKIKEEHIRPIINEAPLFNIQHAVEVEADDTPDIIASKTMKEAIRARKRYKGSGSPIFFTTEDVLTEMILLEDGINHRLYKTEQEVATALRAREVVTVEPMEGQQVKIDNVNYDLIGIMVNLADYNVGADKGGEINMFDDFDIDYNQQKYLIETRCSGALIKPFSAITLYKKVVS